MKPNQLYYLIFSIVLSGTAAYAQNPWSIEECIDYAHKNNIRIKRQELMTDISKKNYNQAKFDLLPNLNGSAEHTYSSGRSLNTEIYSWETSEKQQGSMGIGSSVGLFKGLRNYNNIQLNEYEFLSSRAELEKAKNDIAVSIAGAYLQILFDREIVNIAEQQLDVVNQQVERTRKLVEVGNVARGELLRIQAQAANEQVNLINSQNSLHISYLNLTQILDLDSAEGFEIKIPGILAVGEYAIPPVDDIYREGLQLPQIESAQYSVLSAKKNLDMARGQLAPELSLSAYYTTRYTLNISDPLHPDNEWVFKDQLKDNQYKQVGLNLSIPIFNRMAVNTGIQKAKINLSDADLQLELSKQQLYKEIQQARADAVAALEKFRAAQQAVVSNEEAFKYAEQKFNVGLVNSLDYNQAKNDLISAQSQLLQAKYEYYFSIKILDFYRGIPITL